MITNPVVAIRAAIKRNSDRQMVLSEINRISEQLGKYNTARLLASFGLSYQNKYQNRATTALISGLEGCIDYRGKSDVMGNTILKLADTAEECSNQLEKIAKMVNNDTIDVIMAENMDMKQGYILAYLAFAEFFNNFCRNLLVVVSELESAAYNKREVERSTWALLEKQLKPSIRAAGSFVDFVHKNSKGNVAEKLSKMPSLDIDPEIIKTVTRTEGANTVDPAGFNGLGGLLGSIFNLVNPIAWAYASQKVWSEYQLRLIEEDERSLIYLEHRYQELIQIQEDGGATLQTQKSIEKYREALSETRARIKRTRKDLVRELDRG